MSIRFPTPSVEGILFYLEHEGWYDLTDPAPEKYGFIKRTESGVVVTDLVEMGGHIGTWNVLVQILQHIDVPITNVPELAAKIDAEQNSQTGLFGKDIIPTLWGLKLQNQLELSTEKAAPLVAEILEREAAGTLFDMTINKRRLLMDTHPIGLLSMLTKVLHLAGAEWQNPDWVIDQVEQRLGKDYLYHEQPIREKDAPPLGIQAMPERNTPGALAIFHHLGHRPKTLEKTLKAYKRALKGRNLLGVAMAYDDFNVPLSQRFGKQQEQYILDRWDMYRGGFRSKASDSSPSLGATQYMTDAYQRLGNTID